MLPCGRTRPGDPRFRAAATANLKVCVEHLIKRHGLKKTTPAMAQLGITKLRLLSRKKECKAAKKQEKKRKAAAVKEEGKKAKKQRR